MISLFNSLNMIMLFMLFFTVLNESDHIVIEATKKFERKCKAYDEGVIRGIIDKIVDRIIKIEDKKKNKENEYTRFV